MSEKLKARVLAKCGEIAHTECEVGDYHVAEMYDCLYLESMDGVDGDEEKVQTIWLSESIASDSWEWAAAAQILGIQEAKPEPSPSDDMLARAWESGFIIGSCKTPFSNEGKAAALESFLRFAKYSSNALE